MSKASVIIPVYNSERFIAQTIDSVLAQTYPDFEIILVDDGSLDNSKNIITSYGNKIKYIYQENSGVAAARNTGYLASTGDYLLFLDNDDLVPNNKLDLQISFLVNHPEFGLVYSAWQYIDEEASNILGEIKPDKQGHLLEDLLRHTFYISSPGSVVLRREWIEKVGLFDTNLSTCDDFDLWLRLAKMGCGFGYIDEFLFQHRLHKESNSNKVSSLLSCDFALLNKLFLDPELPDNIKAIKTEAYRVLHLEGAARYFRRGKIEAGQEHLCQVFSRDASPHKNNENKFMEWLVAVALDVRVTNPHPFIDMVIDHLPSELIHFQSLRRKTHGRYHIAAAFDAYNNNKFAEVRRHIILSLNQDISIIRNRGFVSIGLRSLFKQ